MELSENCVAGTDAICPEFGRLVKFTGNQKPQGVSL